MNIIFLDFDGVINSEGFFVMRNRNMQGLRMINIDINNEEDKIVQWYMWQINPYNLDILKEIINETSSKVIVISSWKTLKYFNRISEELIKLGIPIIGRTYDNGYNRGYGIKEYLRNNKTINYVLLDDDIFKDYDEELLSHLVKTTFTNGLTLKEKEKALKILKK